METIRVARILAAATVLAGLAFIGSTDSVGAVGVAARCRPPDVKNLGYVSNLGDNTVDVIDLAHDKVVARIPGFDYPFNQEISDDGSTLFVDNARITDPLADTLAVVNLCTRRIVRRIPDPGVPFSSLQKNGAVLYSTPSVSPDLPILEISTKTDAIIRKIPAPPGALHATSYNGKVIWISSQPALIQSYNGRTLKRFGARILSCGEPAVLRLSPNGKYLISLDTEDCLTIVNTATRKVVHLHTGPAGNPAFGSFTPNGRYFWAGGYSGKVWVVDMRTLSIVKRIPAGGFSVGVNFSRDGRKAYVSTTPANTVNAPTDLATLALAIADVWKPGGLIRVYNTKTFRQLDHFKVGNIPMLISVPAGPFASSHH
jgi:YVTN family beta-propeller protein